MSFEQATAIADAVLMEGYTLYPYRASAPKNRYRWTFGVLAPRAWAEAGNCEPSWLVTEMLVAGAPRRIQARVRCFQIERRVADDWEEGVVRAIDVEIPEGATTVPFTFAGSNDGVCVRAAIDGAITVTRREIAGPQPLQKLAIRIDNLTPWSDLAAPRARVMSASLASVHVLVAVDGGELLSAIDPPAWARDAARTCINRRLHPVLVGAHGRGDVMLAAPFIMADHPTIAPESTGDLCDASEIDELLVLRTRTLTDDEKREARATDPRAAAIVDRACAMPDAALARLHGATRDLLAGEMIARGPAPGAKVRLLAPQRRTDAQDLLFVGRVATVVEVRDDVDGTRFVGVTIDDDPAAELHRWYGRCHYYRLDEVELL